MRSWADPSTSVATLPLQRRYHYYTEEFLPLLFST